MATPRKPDAFWDECRRLFQPPKLPGWVWLVLGLLVRIPDWSGRLDYWNNMAARFGGLLAVIMAIIGSPLFSGAFVAFGIGYLLFVGEPKRTVRSQYWPWIGWGVAGVGFLMVFGAFVAAYTASLVHLPRHLTSAGRKTITAEIHKIVKQFPTPVTVASLQSPESITYAVEIENALIAGGLLLDIGDNLTLIPHYMIGNTPGVFIQVADIAKPPELAKKLRAVLKDGGVQTQYMQNYQSTPGEFVLSIGDNP